MKRTADKFPGLSARRLCGITGVLPQTRENWADRGLLARKRAYGQVDAIEQAVLAQLLKVLPKAEATLAWQQVREQLRRQVPGRLCSIVWDPRPRRASLANTEREIVDLVRHGRQVFVVPVAELIDEARLSYQAEVEAWKAKAGRSIKKADGQQRETKCSPPEIPSRLKEL